MYNIDAICQELIVHLPEILINFGIKYDSHWNRISMSCPLHPSNKSDSLCIFTKPYQNGIVGNYICFTNHCEQTHGRSLVHFIKAYLNLNKPTSFEDVLIWCKQYLTGNLQEYNLDKDKQAFIRLNTTLQDYTKYKFFLTREEFRSKIQIPATFYLNRGYNKFILDKYDIGVCFDEKKSFMVGY